MPPERWQVFLDTNILIAGLLSRTGASAAILDLAEAEETIAVVSQQVLVEADRTFLAKFPQLVERYRVFLTSLAPILVDDATRVQVRAAERVIDADDAPILAAAKASRAAYLVTLNTKHFLLPQVRAFLSIPIVTPSEFLGLFRKYWETL